MSYSFRMNNITDLKYKSTIDHLGIENVQLENYSALNIDGMWPQGVNHLYINGKSTRSIEVEYDNNSFSIRIFSSSSPDDYILACKLAKVIASRYGTDIQPEDGESVSHMGFPNKYDSQWCTQHSHQMIDMILSMARSSPSEVKFPTPKGEYVIGTKLLEQLDKSENIHQEFIERIKTFNYIDKTDTFVPSLMVLHNSAKTKEVKVTTLGESVTSLLTTKADLVGLMSFNEQKAIVKTDDLIGLLNDDITWISETHFYIEGLSGSAWKTLFVKASKYHLNDIFCAGSEISSDNLEEAIEQEPQITSFKEEFTDEQWQKLILAPYLVLLMVYQSDEKIEPKKLEAISEIIVKVRNPLLVEIARDCDATPVEIIDQIMQLDENIAFILHETGSLIDHKLPEIYAASFKTELYMIAQKAMDSSQGLLNPSEVKIKEEQKVLQMLSYLLNIEV
ncbi:MAG: DUF4299 family protein [Desulfobulbaceae bacterium]|nr:DUF4299 family protein [Desulfobulbaceae bacterium]